jgi:predicted Zn-dependent peptidase
MYNEYYYNIVFQEIREARGLAYSAGSWISTPGKPDRSFFVEAFVASQADKLKEATSTLMGLMQNMKEDQNQFDLARESVMNRIETERIIKTGIFWRYLNNLDKGITYDNRKDIYEEVKNFKMEDLREFLDDHKTGNFTMLVIGKKDEVDTNVLNKLGDYKELTLEEIFNY